MKVLMSPIEMIAWFEVSGIPRPIRFRHDGNVVKVEQIIHLSEDRIFECQRQIHGYIKRFEIK